MKFLMTYANIANRSRVVYDPSTGAARILKVKTTEGSIANAVVGMLKSALEKLPADERVNVYVPNSVAIPVMEALKVRKYVVMEDFDASNEDEVEVYDGYVSRITAAIGEITEEMLADLAKPEDGYTEEQINLLCAFCEAGMVNQWSDREAIECLLTLHFRGNRVKSIDSLVEEFKVERKGRAVKPSELTSKLRGIAQDLIDSCKLPELDVVEEEEE